MTQEDHQICVNPNCIKCRNKIKFEMPKDIVEAVKKEELVIFAGAGISTEKKTVYPYSFYQEIESELKLSKKNNPTFSKLMSEYCKPPNGRRKLLNKIKQRFDYLYDFPQLYNEASEFHIALSTIYSIKEIITTNWDDLFERECGAIPIITPEDFIFWNSPDRKVLKLHGSITNLGTIVATEEDYKKCYSRLNKGIIGSFLKTLLATKTILFVGYSFGDEDFNKVYNFLRMEMKNLNPRAYLVTVDEEAKLKFEKLKISVIQTDATYFIETLKEILVKEKQFIPDERLFTILSVLSRVKNVHNELYEKYSSEEYPEILYSGFYQDGLIHALERIISKYNTGEYSEKERVIGIIKIYDNLLKQKMKKKNFGDVAYINGYINGLLYFICDDLRETIPCYLILGIKQDIYDLKTFDKLLKTNTGKHKIYYEYAKKLVTPKDIIQHHPPFL